MRTFLDILGWNPAASFRSRAVFCGGDDDEPSSAEPGGGGDDNTTPVPTDDVTFTTIDLDTGEQTPVVTYDYMGNTYDNVFDYHDAIFDDDDDFVIVETKLS